MEKSPSEVMTRTVVAETDCEKREILTTSASHSLREKILEY